MVEREEIEKVDASAFGPAFDTSGECLVVVLAVEEERIEQATDEAGIVADDGFGDELLGREAVGF